MKIQTKSSRKIYISIAVFVLILAFAFTVFYVIHRHEARPIPNTGDIKNPSTAEQAEKSKTDLNTKKHTIENPPPSTAPVQPINSPDSVQLQATQQGENIIINTKLLNFPNGKCNLAITNSGTTKEYTTSILYQEQYSICTGFSIPKNDLGNGTWSVTLTATTDAGTSLHNQTKITVN